MTVTFFINYLNHHQVFLGDELYKLLGDGFRFVATMPQNRKELKGGKDYSDRPYLIQAGINDGVQRLIGRLIDESDVCVFGACSQQYAVRRSRGLSFEVGERWLKKGPLNILSCSFAKWAKNYSLYYRKRQFYKLCAGGFVAKDDEALGCYKGRHYKWGYFTDVDNILLESQHDCRNKIIWAGRFIKLKHPELAIGLAVRLRETGREFSLDMYGDGPMLPYIKRIIEQHNLGPYVSLHGAVENAKVRRAMRDGDIFLFTSNQLEGWGAVANEAMSAGCALVSSADIGSTPYLIRDGYNGFSFKTCNINDLTEKVCWLLDNPNELKNMKLNAQKDMIDIWSPKNAALSLLKLVDDLRNGRECSIKFGPCSKA